MENSLLAPVNLFTYLHFTDTKNRKKTVMLPVMHDDPSNPAATMAAQDYSGDSAIRQEESAIPILPHLDLLENDAVERNRTKLPRVWSIFIPDQISYHPVNFLDIEHPYAKSTPSFFPQGLGDFDSATRSFQVSETDFVIHYLRYARKELSTFTPFIFHSLYRIDTARTVASSRAYRGFSSQGAADGEETGDPGSKFLFYKLPGSSDYYAKINKDLQAKCKVLGYPEFFYTFTNTDR